MSSKFKSVADAQFWYFKNWNTSPHNATDIKKDAKIGSISGWKTFVKACKTFHSLHKSNSRNIALQKTFEKYKRVRLVQASEWKPTVGTPGLRKGQTPHHVFAKKKTGPKSKFSNNTRRACLQLAD